MITIKYKGDLKNTDNFFRSMTELDVRNILARAGQEGLAALASATPEDSGLTSESWSYSVTKTRNGYSISWFNDRVTDGVPVVILLQYGHATRSGGYVVGRDFINPVMRPIFDRILTRITEEVKT